MENVQELTERVKVVLQEEKPEEEIFQWISSVFKENPEMAEGIAEGLARVPHDTVARILQRLLEGTRDKKLQKTIRRSLYRLKSRGIRVEDRDVRRGQSILRPAHTEPPQGFGSGIDRHGHRLLMLVIPHAARGWTVVHGLIGDTQGLVNFTGEEMTRKGFRGFFETFRSKSPFPIVEMEAPYVGLLLSRAYQLTLEKKGIPPQDYLRSKAEIEGVRKEYARPLIYSYLSEDEVAGDDSWIHRVRDLLKDELFATWAIEEAQIRPYADAVVEARESRLFISQNQKEARFQEIYLSALTEIFPNGMKAVYRRRLEETAYVLHRLGREEKARVSLSVAMDLSKPLNPIQPNPFLLQLVMRSVIALLSETEEKKGKEPSLILKP